MLLKSQQGMSMVSVLMLSTLAATVAFGALNTAVTQNRISGNFQKNLNAQQQAEQALFDSFHRMNQYIRDNPTATAADIAAIAANDAKDTVRNNHIESVQLLSDQLLLTGKGGFQHDSVSRQAAKLRFIPGVTSTPVTPFDFALTGCDSVNLGGSGAIQSYDSRDPNAAPTGADVRTVNANSSLTLSGASPINGSVQVRGDITMNGSAHVTGSVRANGNITLANAGAVINGDVHAFRGITVTNTPRVLGELRANENISISNGITIGNGIKTKGNLVVTGGANVSNAVLVQGNITITQWVADGNSFKNKSQIFYGGTTQHNFGTRNPALTVEAVELLPNNETDSSHAEFNRLCDPLNLPSLFQNAAIPNVPNERFRVNQDWNKRKYEFNGSTGNAYFTDNADSRFALAAQPFTFGNDKTPTFFLGGLDIASNAVVSIVGDVRLFLKQGMSLRDDAQFVIKPNSTLTIITEGKIEITGSGRFRTAEGGNTRPEGLVKGKPVLAIYSNYQSQNARDNGILLSGASSGLYAAIYAPASHIKVTAGNSFSGSAIGKTLSVDGAGFIRYDQALKTVSPGDNTGPGNRPPRLTFGGF